MADGDHCHSILINGDHIIFNRPMFLSIYYEQRGDVFVPGGLLLSFWDNHRREEPNQAERPVPPLQPTAANDEPHPPALPVVPLEPLEEPEEFLLYDYYDTEYSDTEDSDTEDSDLEVGGDENKEGGDEKDQIDQNSVKEEEVDKSCDGGSKKRPREDKEEEEGRSAQRFCHECDCVLEKFQNQPAAAAGNQDAFRDEENGVVDGESMKVNKNPDGQEDSEEKLLPKGSTKGGEDKEDVEDSKNALPLHS